MTKMLTRLELVKTIQSCQSGSSEGPRREGPHNRELALVQVVGKKAVKADV